MAAAATSTLDAMSANSAYIADMFNRTGPALRQIREIQERLRKRRLEKKRAALLPISYQCTKKTKCGPQCSRAAIVGAEGKGLCSQHRPKRMKRDAFCGYVAKSGNKEDPFLVPDDDGKRHGH